MINLKNLWVFGNLVPVFGHFYKLNESYWQNLIKLMRKLLSFRLQMIQTVQRWLSFVFPTGFNWFRIHLCPSFWQIRFHFHPKCHLTLFEFSAMFYSTAFGSIPLLITGPWCLALSLQNKTPACLNVISTPTKIITAQNIVFPMELQCAAEASVV